MLEEVELKFDLDPGDVDAVLCAPPLEAAECGAVSYETIYFDTPDRALDRAGFSLRVRHAGDRFIQTIKQKNGGSVGLFVRREWEADVPDFAVAPALLETSELRRILARKGIASLQPVMRTDFRRTRWLVERRGSRVEVVLDQGRVVSGEDETPLCELELELIEGKRSVLFRLAEEIGGAAPLRLGVMSKGERGYALADGRLGGAVRAEPVRLVPSMTEDQAFRATAMACLRHFRLNEIGLLSGLRDPEILHQARVAMRRLRSAMTLFRPTLQSDEFKPLRQELGWFARQLGEARNLDVLVAAYRKEAVPENLARLREEAYEHVAATLHAARVRALFLRLAMWIEGGSWRDRARANREIGALARKRLDRQWEQVAQCGPAIDELDADALHRLRVDVKKLRYSAEFLSGLFPHRPACVQRNRFITALKALQERLGELNDLEIEPSLAPAGAAARGRARSPGKLIKAAQQAYQRAAAEADYWSA
jgi:inorganic triphosphatase YgiF